MANEKESRDVQRLRYRWSPIVVIISLLASIATAYLLPRKPSAVERAIEAKLADLRSRCVPLTPAEVAKTLPDPDPNYDARIVLAKAIELAQRETDSADLPLLGGGQLPKRTEAIPEPVMNEIRLLLADGAVKKAVPDCLDGVRFSMKWNCGSTKLPYPRFWEIRALIQTLALQAIYDAENGNSVGAFEALRKGFQIAWTMNDDDLTMTMLRVACANAMCNATEQVLNRIHPTATELMELERQIAPERIGDFRNAFVTERAVGLMWFDEARKEYGKRNLKTRFKEAAQVISRKAQPGYRDEDRLLFLNSVEARERTRSLQAVACLQSNSNITTEYWNRVKSVAGGEIGGTFWRKTLMVAFETRARLIALKSALAVERYRLSKPGCLLSTLGDLVPDYLPTLPTDFFGDQPLRYEKREAGYVIYSIGADGKDDSGKEPATPQEPDAYDITIILERQ